MNHNAVIIKAYAKVNLCLDITGIADNGWHYLDTIIAPIPIFDLVKITKREDKKISVTYDSGAMFLNDVAYKMAKIIQDTYDTSGVDIFINKVIPVASGIGGSSADAAAVAIGMRKLFSLCDIDSTILMKAGSDIPAMYKGGITRVRGFGEKVGTVSLPKSLYVSLLIDETVQLKTEDIYKMYDSIGGAHGLVDDYLKNLKPFNSLEKTAISINSNVKRLNNLLSMAGFEYVVMTGSGSGVIGYALDEKKHLDVVKNLEGLLVGKKTSHYKFKIDKDGFIRD
ncbi:MAG: hypothetical protein GX959_03915 [Clostridiales bacterium]|nr:hypothetical protein [Clostridiales bacterium]